MKAAHSSIVAYATLAFFAAGAPVPALAAAMGEQEYIEKALSAAPPQLRPNATVVGPEGKVLQEGEGTFTCMLGPDQIGNAPMCIDKAWMPWAEAWMNQKEYTPAPTVGFAYMLAGDTLGASNINPYDTDPTDDNEWVAEGPHVMVIVPDQALIEHLPTDPDYGGPYVMWKGTPLAHVMWPVAERPEQPQAAERK